MTALERTGSDPDEYQPAETIVLDEDSAMATDEFRTLIDPRVPDEVEPPAQDYRGI